MKKTGIILLTAALSAASLTCTASANTSAEVTVTIANAGTIEVAAEQITLTDADGDGALTLNDALIIAHDQFYEGDGGYKSYTSDWGLSIETLWGVTNGGSYGYMVNDGYVMSLAEPLTDGDALYAYVYADAASFTDEYTFFDVRTAEGLTQGDTLTLQLSGNTYDENWNMVTEPIADAVITVGGQRTPFKTDAEGNVTVTLEQSGDVIISAVSESRVIIPPVFRASVTASAETTAAASTTTAEATSATTAAPVHTTRNGSPAAATTAAAAKTGDTDVIPALAVTALLAAGTGFALRRRHER